MNRPKFGAAFGAARVALRGAALAAALAALAGCTASDVLPLGYDDLPESPEVQTAEWPRLIDAPRPVSQTGPVSVQTNADKGRSIISEIETDAAELAEAEAALRQRPVVYDPGIEAEAAALRAEGAKIDAE